MPQPSDQKTPRNIAQVSDQSPHTPGSWALPFVKIVPGGNATIIVPHNALNGMPLPLAAQQLMSGNHIQAEQVGSLTMPKGNSLPHLQMMGGEFCVNATRASAALLDNEGILQEISAGCRAGYMTVSGSETPILTATAFSPDGLNETIAQLAQLSSPDSAVASSDASLSLASIFNTNQPALKTKAPLQSCLTSSMIQDQPPSEPCIPDAFFPAVQRSRLYTAARLTCTMQADTIEHIDDLTSLVHLPGISHLLIALPNGQFPLPHECQQLAGKYRSAYGLERLPASGTIWYKPDGDKMSIMPAVYVRDTNSLCLETACGSASLALALHLYFNASSERQERQHSCTVIQPSSEELSVHIEPPLHHIGSSQPQDMQVWVSGATHIVATGTAYLQRLMDTCASV